MSKEEAQARDRFIESLIHCGSLQIGKVQHTSGVFSGNNLLFGWQHRAKVNDGFGSLHGNRSVVEDSVTEVRDADTIDTHQTKRPGQRE